MHKRIDAVLYFVMEVFFLYVASVDFHRRVNPPNEPIRANKSCRARQEAVDDADHETVGKV